MAYNSEIYSGPQEKDRKLVLRLSAAKHGKGLKTFFEVSKLCPDHTFVLGVADVSAERRYFEALEELNRSIAGRRVQLLHNVPWDRARALTRKAAIYLGTSDSHGHAFGMPISVAESLATGGYVMLRKDEPAAAEYLGNAGTLYESAAHAAELIQNSTSWDDETWASVHAVAINRAAGFADWSVLSRVIDDWKAMLA